MATAFITQFELDEERRAVISPCIDDFQTPNPEAEWPAGILSNRTVVYSSGVIARRGDPIRHNVNPDELARCKLLATEADTLLRDIGLGLRSEGHQDYRGFFIVTNAGAPVPKKIDAHLIRSRFGGTIFPQATIEIEALGEGSRWWSSILQSAEIVAEDEEPDPDEEAEERDPDWIPFLDRWKRMFRWFRERPEFQDTAFVAIGDYDALHRLEPDLPPGTQYIPCTHPRLFLGLTYSGSLVGLFGYVVET